MNKSQWLDWLETCADHMQARYREAWNRAPRAAIGPRTATPIEVPRPWSAIRPKIDREDRQVVVHLELPEPHTVEADVRVIGSTLSITVLKSGSGIHGASAENCYRRAIPLPAEVDPGSATHEVHGDELVIRMLPERSRQPGGRSRAPATRAPAAAETPEPAENRSADPRSNRAPRKPAAAGPRKRKRSGAGQ